ncbi:MAG: hypothetical protein HY781_05570 [Chloroflexi bacterium]|nr:hypothetical protein [Chloroflexota bacterium]
MNNLRFPTPLFIIFLLLASACSTPGSTRVDADAFDTMVAQTAVLGMTQTALGLPQVPSGPTPTPSPDYSYPPDPLPASNTGFILKAGECWDLDTMTPVIDTFCDLALDSNGVLTPRNLALLGGTGRQSPPTLDTCRAETLASDPAAPLTDLHLCFQTNTGVYGFLVLRDDQMLTNQQMVFDIWLFVPYSSP